MYNSDYSQQYCSINLKIAKRLDLNCSLYKKMIMCGTINVLANATVVTLQYINTGHLKLKRCYLSIISQ